MARNANRGPEPADLEFWPAVLDSLAHGGVAQLEERLHGMQEVRGFESHHLHSWIGAASQDAAPCAPRQGPRTAGSARSERPRGASMRRIRPGHPSGSTPVDGLTSSIRLLP